VLEDVVRLMTDAGRLADRVADLCRRGESVDNELVGLTAAVRSVVTCLPNGVPPTLSGRWHDLSRKVATATAAADARRVDLAVELEQHARLDRVRKAYVRPPA
jgi:hypothetical protein